MFGYVVFPQLWTGVVALVGLLMCGVGVLALIVDIVVSIRKPKFEFDIAKFWIPCLVLGLFLAIFGWLTVPGAILAFVAGWVGDRI